jgi:hypothetical protein
VIGTAFFLLMGGFLTWSGWRHWRYRKVETISVLEAAILKTTGVEPLPTTRVDRTLKYVHAALAFIFGPIFMLIGILGILNEVGLL